MEGNPYAPPQSELEAGQAGTGGLVMPFEDPQTYPAFSQRVLETLRWLFTDLHKAGQGLSGSRRIGAPVGFYALLALLPMMVIGLLGIIHPVQAIWQVWMGTPRMQPAAGPMLAFMLLGVLIAGPLGAGLGILVVGLLDHLGLWIVRGTQQGLGLPVTFRSVIYASTVIAIASLPFQLLGHLPGMIGSYALLPVVLLQVASVFYQGLLLSRAHRTETWRGMLGVWLPILVLMGLAALCVGALWIMGGEVFHRIILENLHGGA